VRNDARAAGQLALQLRAQRAVELRREEQHHHRGARQRHVHEIVLDELDALGDPGPARVVTALGDALRIDVDAHAARAAPRRRDDDAAVAAAQVVDRVAGLHRGELHHRLHHLHRRGLVAHVRWAKASRRATGDEQGAGKGETAAHFAKGSAFGGQHG